MINQEKFLNCLKQEGIEFITGIPDTLLNDFCLYVEEKWSKNHHIIAANEGNAIALAAGFYLATKTIPLVYLQNSGLGNIVNPFLSLTDKDVYGIPMVLLIGWRGEPDLLDHIQHQKQGALTPTLLNDMDIPFKILEHNIDDAVNKLKWAKRTSEEINSAVALIVKKGILANGKKESFNNNGSKLMFREEAIKKVLEFLPENAVYVGSTGRTSRELYESRNIRNEGHEKDFLNVGAMGHTSSIAHGIWAGTKNRLVVCIEGDSSALMHLGSFATTGIIKKKNFLHIVLNNGVHESVGGQQSAGILIDFTGIAQNSGYNTVGSAVKTVEDLERAIHTLALQNGPGFIEIKIKKGMRTGMPCLKLDFKKSKQNFMKNLME